MRWIIAALAFASMQDPPEWWNKEYAHRRRLIVQNRSDEVLKAGYPKDVEIDPDYFKDSRDLSDLVLIHGGKEVPFLLMPGRKAATRTLWFRTVSDVKKEGKEGRDDGYFLYYGGPKRKSAATDVFEFHEDFSSGKINPNRFDVDKDLAVAARDGALVITGASHDRTEHSPARIAVKAVPPAGGFALSFDVVCQPAENSIFSFGIEINMKEPAADDAKVNDQVDELIEKLGAMDWEAREKATVELIKIGRPAMKKLEEALKSSDAEVKWRAEHIIREIREKIAPPTIFAGFRVGDAELRPAAKSWTVGKTRGKQRLTSQDGRIQVRLSIQRDEAHDVKILWDDRELTRATLTGEVRDIAFTIFKGTAGNLGEIAISNILLRRYLDDDSRPTHVLEIEESRK